MLRLLLLSSVFAAVLFAAPTRDERPPALRGYGKADGTVVVAMSPTCPCSRSHEPVLESLVHRFPRFGFVGIRSPEPIAETYFAGRKLSFPVVAAKGAAAALGALKTPHVFVYDAQGALRYKGGVDDSHDVARAKTPFLAATLTALTEGRDVPVTETRPLGCRVDWE